MSLRVVYIGGYSRSGSTILDILLSQHPQISGTGELCYLFDDWCDGNRTCSCGQVYAQCAFWSDLAKELDLPAANALIRKVEHRANFANIVNDRLPDSLVAKYKTYQETIFGYIQERSGTDIIVDSSKTTRNSAGRCLALCKYTELDTCMIHLAKNGRSTTKSFLQKGRNWAMEGHAKNSYLQGLRSIVGWRLANDIANKSGVHMSASYQLVKYEDLITDPRSNLQALGTFLGIEVAGLIDMVSSKATLEAKHQVGGNRLRRQKNLRFGANASVVEYPRLDLFHSLSFDIIAGSTYRKLGYLRH